MNIELKNFFKIIALDAKSYVRRQSEWLSPVLFFSMIVSIFAISLNGSPQLLKAVGNGVIWSSFVLATLLSIDNVLRQDYEEGFLEQLLLLPYPLWSIMLAKACAHWLCSVLPLILICPVLALLLHFELGSICVLIVALLIATPILSLLGLIAGALTLGLKRGGILLSILVLPLYVPVIMFGSQLVTVFEQGLSLKGHVALLIALLLMALLLAPMTIASAVKISLAE